MEPGLDRRGAMRWIGAGAASMLAGCSSRVATAARTGFVSRVEAPPTSTTAHGSPTPMIATASTVAGSSTGTSALAPEPALGLEARFDGLVPSQWGTDVSGVATRFDTSLPIMALTFDACGGPRGDGVDQTLIDLLIREGLPATLFLNGRWIDANPAVTEALIAHPLFEIENHGSHHRPLSVNGRSAYGIAGCTSVAAVIDEVESNHERLSALLGHPPRFFRSGTAYYDEVATQIVAALGETPVSFSVNGDAGATLNAPEMVRALARPAAGAVVIMHMNQPRRATAAGLAAALPSLRASGVQFVTLTGANIALVPR